MTLARAAVAVICLLSSPVSPAWAAQKRLGPCLVAPSLAAIDAAIDEVSLATVDSERVLRLRGAVSHHLARGETEPARVALFNAMGLLGYVYVQGEASNARSCPPGAWQRQP
jgi:hypothetical protein